MATDIIIASKFFAFNIININEIFFFLLFKESLESNFSMNNRSIY